MSCVIKGLKLCSSSISFHVLPFFCGTSFLTCWFQLYCSFSLGHYTFTFMFKTPFWTHSLFLTCVQHMVIKPDSNICNIESFCLPNFLSLFLPGDCQTIKLLCIKQCLVFASLITMASYGSKLQKQSVTSRPLYFTTCKNNSVFLSHSPLAYKHLNTACD